MFKSISKFINSHAIGQLFNLGEKTVAWRKVRELKTGMRIAIAPTSLRGGTPTWQSIQIDSRSPREYLPANATHQALQAGARDDTVEWDEIISIKKLHPERVWDIEVEGTHNFVAGHYLNQRTKTPLTSDDEIIYSDLQNLELRTWNLDDPAERATKLREIRDLARRYGIDPRDLFDHRKLSQVRTLWDNQPVETSDVVSTIKYSRGARAGKQTGVRPISIDSAGVGQRSVDIAQDLGGVGIDFQTRSSEIEKQIARLIQENKVTSKDLELAAKKLRQVLGDKLRRSLSLNLELRTKNLDRDTKPQVLISKTLSGQAPSSKFQDPLDFIEFGGIVAHNTSGILMRAGAASLQLSSSATSTTADIELAAADQMDLFAGRFSLTTSSGTAGDVKIDSAGTLTLSTSRNNTNVALLSGSGAFNVTACTANGYYLGIDASGYPNFYLDTNGVTAGCDAQISSLATGKINDGAWHYLSVSVTRGTSALLYLDGVQISSDTSVTSYSSITVTGNIQIASSANYDGVIDVINFYSRALGAPEILANYQAGNVELQTRTGTTTTPNDGTWEAWKPTTSETQIDAVDSLSPVEKISQTSLTAYWKLDETSGSRADSKGTNTLTDNATVTYAPGRLGNSADFERDNTEYLSLLDNADMSTGDIDFTFAGWVYTEADNAANMRIATKGSETAANAEWKLYRNTSSGTAYFSATLDGAYVTGCGIESNTALPVGGWAYVIAWHDAAANTCNIQVNNNLATSTSYSSGVTDRAGAFNIGAENGTASFDGLIDEVAFWKRTLTTAERTRLFEDGLDLHGAGSGRIYRSADTTTKIEGTASEKLQIGAPQCGTGVTTAIWHLEETSGTRNDACGSNNLTDNATVTVKDGFYGKAGQFTAANSEYLSIADNASLSTGNIDFSISTWVYLDSKSATMNFVKKTDSATGDEYYLRYIQSSDRFNFGVNSGQVTANTFGSPPTGVWIFLVGWLDSSTGTVYISVNNGTPDSTGSATGADTAYSFFIGSGNGEGYMNGRIDEVMFTKRVLSAEERAEAYRAGRDHRLTKTISSKDLSNSSKLPYYIAADRPGTYLETTVGESALLNNFAGDPDLKGYWPLDENSTGAAAVTRNDYSGNGNNLTDNATVTSTQGKIGKAGQFTAANNEYLSIADNAALSTGNIDFTLSGYLYFDTTDTSPFIISKYASGEKEYALAFNTSIANRISFYVSVDGGADVVVDDTTPISTGTWYFVVAWHDSVANTINIQVNNGSILSTSHTTGVRDGSAAFYIGGRSWSGSLLPFNGRIDNVMFLKRVLTADERRQMFEIGKRTHPVTIDFVTSPQAAYSSGTSVTINNPYGTTNLTDTLSIGDTMIFKENVGGTETVSQAVVTGITNTSSTYGTVTLLAAPTFPSGGYTTNATVFKWQREFMDITGIPPGSSNSPQNPLNSSKDAISRITIRVTDGNEGRTVWLDDFKSAGPYLTVGSARTSTIASTPQQYFQYRVIFTTTDTAVTPTLTSISLQYHSDPQKVTGADTFASGTYDNDGNLHLGSNNVKDVYFYDRTKDQISYALETDGSNDYVDIGTGPTSVKTVEFWVYPETTTEYFINLTSTTDYIWVNAGTITATGFAAPIIYVNGAVSSTLVADQWQHVAITDTAGENASNFDIGRTADANYLEGKIDEVALFSDVRTAAEVVNDYNARRLAGTEDALVAVYHFDDGSGTRAYDSVGNFHGTLTNMTDDDWVNSLSDRDQSALSQQVLGVDPNWPNGPARQSYALDFDGSNEYVNAGSATSLDDLPTGNVTWEAWFTVNWTTDAFKYIISKRPTNLVGYAIGVNPGVSQTYVAIEHSGTTIQQVFANTSFSVGRWYHIAVSFDGASSKIAKLYIDGTLIGSSNAASGTYSSDASGNQVIGVTGELSAQYFNGQIDEVAVFNTARTAAQISSDYNTRRLKGNETNLQGLWHFDEGTDNTCSGGTNDVCDASSNANDGAKTNMEEGDFVTDARAVMDNNARYVSLGSSSAVNTDRGMEIKITSTTAFQYRWTGDQAWTTPATSTLSSYSFTSPAQIDSTGVYVGFDTTNGTFGDESYFLIPSWALEQFSNSDTQNAMRGTKRGFPERSYLVATDKGVDIIDADTNNLWMRIENGSGRSLATFTNNTPSSVFMSQGQLLVGTNGSAATGLYRYDFNRDKIYRYDATDRRTNTVNIAKRNTADSSYGSADTTQNLISSVVNDAHAITIQGKLLLAAATDTGVTKISNIMSSDTSYDYSDNASDDYGHVVLAENAGGAGDLYADNDTTDALERWNNVLDDAASETAGTPDTTYDETSTPAIFVTAATEINDLKLTNQTSTVEAASPTIYIAHDLGTTVLAEKRSDPTNGSVKYLTKDYISEELIGDTRGMWPLSANGAISMSDASVKADTLTNNGTATFVTGVRGGGVSLNGTTQYLSCTDAACGGTTKLDYTGSGGWSVGTWIKPSNTQNGVIVNKYGADGQYAYYLAYISQQVKACASSTGASGQELCANSTATTGSGSWAFAAITYDGTTLKTYLNGVQDGSVSLSGIFNSTADFTIGYGAGAYFAGTIDEPFVTAEALTATQISQMYVSGKEALNNKYRVKLASDTVNQLNGSTNITKAVGRGGEYLYIGANGASADDGSLSRVLVNGDTRDREYDESTKEPYLLTDNDINSVSISNDGAYIVVGTDDAGVTIIQNGSNAVRLRGGSKVQGPSKRPHN